MINLDEISLLSGFDDKLKKTIKGMNLLDPIVLLVGLANGKDLTCHSLIYEWVLNHESENGEEPPEEWEWLDLVEMVKEHSRFYPVEEKTRILAQKILAEYQHSKRRSIEITDNSAHIDTKPLTRREIKRFNRFFNNEY